MKTPADHVQAWFSGRPACAALYDREALAPGHAFAGPAILRQDDTTTVILPDFRVEVDGFGNLLIVKGA